MVSPQGQQGRDCGPAAGAAVEATGVGPDRGRERVFPPSIQWPPPPPQSAYLTACEALTWIGWGGARPKESASEFEAELLEVWGVSSDCFGDLIHAFETGQPQESLIATPEQVRDHIQKREGREYTLAELAERLRKDRAVLAKASELLELASEVLIKACVDGELQAVGRRGAEMARTIPNEVFFQAGVTVTWWDTIEADCVSWECVRFRASDVRRLWPPHAPAPDQSPPAVVAHLPSFARLARIGRLMERLAQTSDWVNGDKLRGLWNLPGWRSDRRGTEATL